MRGVLASLILQTSSLIATAAFAQSGDAALADCTSGDQARRIRGCGYIVQEKPVRSIKRLVTALDGMCWSYHLASDFRRAKEFCDEAIRIDPNYAYAYNNRGVAYKGLGNLTEALADFDRAIQIRSSFVVAHKNRIRTLVDLGRYQSAQESIDALRAVRPTDQDVAAIQSDLSQRRLAALPQQSNPRGSIESPEPKSPGTDVRPRASSEAAISRSLDETRAAAVAIGIPLRGLPPSITASPMPPPNPAGSASETRVPTPSNENVAVERKQDSADDKRQWDETAKRSQERLQEALLEPDKPSDADDEIFMKASAFILSGDANQPIKFNRAQCTASLPERPVDAQKLDYFSAMVAVQSLQSRFMNGDTKKLEYNKIDVESIKFGIEVAPRAEKTSAYRMQLATSANTDSGQVKIITKTYSSTSFPQAEAQSDRDTLKRAWTRIYSDYCKGKKPDF